MLPHLFAMMGPDAMILVFWMLNFKPTFSLSSFTFIKRLFSSSSLYAISFFFTFFTFCQLHIWVYWYFSQQSWSQLVLHPSQCFSWCTLLTLTGRQIWQLTSTQLGGVGLSIIHYFIKFPDTIFIKDLLFLLICQYSVNTSCTVTYPMSNRICTPYQIVKGVEKCNKMMGEAKTPFKKIQYL